MPRSIATKQANAIKRVKPPAKAQAPDQTTANLSATPKILEVEQAAAKVKHRAEKPVDRTAELLLGEAEVTDAGISSPEGAKQTIRAGR